MTDKPFKVPPVLSTGGMVPTEFDPVRTQADRYNQGKPPMELLDRYALEQLALVMDFGRRKYSKHNWRKGLPHSEILACGIRHLLAALESEDNDPDSGLPHVAHAMANCMMYLANAKYHPELDDRFNPNPQE